MLQHDVTQRAAADRAIIFRVYADPQCFKGDQINYSILLIKIMHEFCIFFIFMCISKNSCITRPLLKKSSVQYEFIPLSREEQVLFSYYPPYFLM
jgi:hypothetical protein